MCCFCFSEKKKKKKNLRKTKLIRADIVFSARQVQVPCYPIREEIGNGLGRVCLHSGKKQPNVL